ncbi:hypothetical protein GM3708_1542 [Geminocystis sp. NIES-3708]|nr:hypothetical protein GM3708_1542 [Geminocystis sp. NIES-3708]
MKLRNIQITIIVIGSILVALLFISRITEQYDYRKQIIKIKEYVTKISDSKKQCTINFKKNIVTSDCAESLKLKNH